MPDLVYLTSQKHAQVINRSNELMRAAIAQMQQQQSGGNGAQPKAEQPKAANERADAIWRGELD
jgi:hypothetical protein